MSVTFFAPDAQQATEGLELNVSNVNAVHLCELLGYPRETWTEQGICAAECDADEFLGRVLVAQGLNPADEGVPWTVDQQRSNWTDCGRSEGYDEHRLGCLRDLATAARAHGSVIAWG